MKLEALWAVPVVSLLFLMLPLSASAATYYVRPAGSVYGAGSGSSYANAFAGFHLLYFPAPVLSSGDYVYVCGSFATTSKYSSGTVMLSVSISGVTFDGDCSAQGDLSRAIIDGGGVLVRGIDSGSGGSTNITLKNLEITGFTADGVLSQGSDMIARNWTLDNLYIHDNRGGSTRGVWSSGAGLTLENSHIENCGEDCVYVDGDNFTATNDTIEWPGLDAGGVQGDVIQMSSSTKNWLVDHLVGRTTVDIKQCLIVNHAAAGESIDGTLSNSQCYGPSSSAANHIAFFFDGPGTVTAYNNYSEKSKYLIYAADGATLNAWNNIGGQLSYAGIQCGTNVAYCSIFNNSIFSAPRGIETNAPGVGNMYLENNAIASTSIVGIDTTASGVQENNNGIFNPTVPLQKANVSTTPDSTDVQTDPLFSSPTSGPDGFSLDTFSPLVDAGVATSSRTTDYYGNPIYGFPDIGAIEYQPPYTMGTNSVNATGAIRVYEDGKYRYTSATSSASSMDFDATPSGGSFYSYSSTAARPSWLDISTITWNTSGTYAKQWTATGQGATTTVFTVGDLVPDAYYTVSVDNAATSTQQADSNGRISYTYTSGWSTHTFDVNATAATCSLSLNDSSIYYGQSATLTWTSTHGLSASLDNSIGSVGLNGSTTVSPAAGTHTYTLTVTGGGSDASATCSATLAVNNAGNGAPVGLISGPGTGSGSDPVSIIPTVATSTANTAVGSTSMPTGTTTSAAAPAPVLKTPGTVAISQATYPRDLTIGDTGDDVTGLQDFLIAGGHTIPAGATGYFGLQTQTALASYQAGHGIAPPVGYFGPITRASVMGNPVSATSEQSTTATSTTAYQFTHNLQLNDTGEDVRQLQIYLNTHGFPVAASGAGSPGSETDYFGLATYKALVRLQDAHADDILTPIGLTAGNGYFGANTRAFVNSH